MTVRYDGVTIVPTANCAWCGSVFVPSGRRLFCSNACKQASYRARRPGPPPVLHTAQPFVVYECPSCERRYLSPERRCEDCNLFCRKVGSGGLCPHCDEPVACTELGC